MKNKTIAFLVVVSLLALPVMASAAAEFTLGGYIKLHLFWDSAAMDKNMAFSPPRRNNDPNGQHGRFEATSTSSRFNFTIKGPELWGAKTTGFIEIDFDEAYDGRMSGSHSYRPRLRHAFFRLNWPGTELLMGQYWDFFGEFFPDFPQDGPFMGHGNASAHRLAQVRLTQTFGLGWAKDDKVSLSFLLGKPTDTNDSFDPVYPIATNANPLEGQTSETPQLQAKISYEGDLWGKANFYGRPRGFTAQVVGGWQRSRYRGFPAGILHEQQYLNNWCVQGTLFLPIIPTATKNLAGTASLTVQGYVGQGLDFLHNDFGGNSYIKFNPATGLFDQYLQKTVGGYVLASYHFTNEWWMNTGVGWAANYGVNYAEAVVNNLGHNWWEVDTCLYYRPITALKFGLGYAYSQGNYYRYVGGENIGQAHRVQFASWFFF